MDTNGGGNFNKQPTMERGRKSTKRNQKSIQHEVTNTFYQRERIADDFNHEMHDSEDKLDDSSELHEQMRRDDDFAT